MRRTEKSAPKLTRSAAFVRDGQADDGNFDWLFPAVQFFTVGFSTQFSMPRYDLVPLRNFVSLQLPFIRL
ncbi:MAG: hypothetical protein QOE96_3114 [Blastocatellia bacterium]|nr:hypothetical protein [Blastocatellia bacterium]